MGRANRRSERAAGLRESAAKKREKAEESFQRSDTDGFLSQWASGLGAQRDDRQAEIEENGGVWTFRCLVDREGNLVPAREIQTRYGYAWGVFDSLEDANSYSNPPIREWVSDSKIGQGKVPYQVAYQVRPARAELRGDGGRGLSGNVWVATVPSDGQRLPADAPIVHEPVAASGAVVDDPQDQESSQTAVSEALAEQYENLTERREELQKRRDLSAEELQQAEESLEVIDDEIDEFVSGPAEEEYQEIMNTRGANKTTFSEALAEQYENLTRRREELQERRDLSEENLQQAERDLEAINDDIDAFVAGPAEEHYQEVMDSDPGR